MIKEYVDSFPLKYTYLMTLARDGILEPDDDMPVSQFNNAVVSELRERISQFEVIVYQGGMQKYVSENDLLEIYYVCKRMSDALRTDGEIPLWMKELVAKFYFMKDYDETVKEIFG